MEKGLESFSFREIIVIIFPGLYFVAIVAPLYNNLGIEMIFFSDKLANSISYIMFSLLVGIIMYWIDIPKKIPFFNNNLPTNILIKEYPNSEKYKIINSYFKFYDTISEDQKKKTNTYTSLYHFCVNIFVLSFLTVILYLVFPPFNYGWIGLINTILSLISVFGLFYGNRKIKYMFTRQLKAFKNSNLINEI